MTLCSVELGSAATDDNVDVEISQYLNPNVPKSFFLYAGAGSGKTRSLVIGLKSFRERHGKQFRKSGQKVAVITYTNAACDEISSRVGDDPLFTISTIHSFCWSQIGLFNADIQDWLKSVIPEEISELQEKQAKGRAGTKAAIDRERSIEEKNKRLEWLSIPRRFTYNPNGDNFGADSLSHSEVLKITANFIETKPSMQAIIINRFPFLLVDESQDTSKYLIDAFFVLEANHYEKFAIGLFGDMMQRIYADGKPDLGKNIPSRWAKPVKRMNHRSPQRIILLGNTLRAPVDAHCQLARDDSEKGVARLFIVPADMHDKQAIEQQILTKMYNITGDNDWTGDRSLVKTLTLEHHMAASRMGFADLFNALDQDSRLTTGLRDGTLPGVRLFSELIAPLIYAYTKSDNFTVMAILRKTSPLLKFSDMKATEDHADSLAKVRQAVDALLQIDVTNPATTFMDILKCVATYNLFNIPNSLKPFIETSNTVEDIDNEQEEDTEVETAPASLQAWRTFLETSYCQIIPYAEYVADIGAFGTHQGVKGLEFDRVLVIMDDSEARGFSFSYEKLFGVKPLTDNDREKIKKGEEIGVDRTRRLLYVTCTRAKKSLALIAYTNAPNKLADSVVHQGWFEPSEIEHL